MAEALKNNYNEAYVKRLAQAIFKAHPAFNRNRFIGKVLDEHWKNRELKSRLHHITHCIHGALRLPYAKSVAILLKACKGFGGYEGMYFPDFVEQYGLENPTKARWKVSMKALEEFTKVSSSEFAVRPFIVQDTEKMMAQMLKWSRHKNHHVRRLASEGCRPRLPWAMGLPAFKKDPGLIFPILDSLKTDESLYVRKSVANNLNDISKDHPDKVLAWCKDNIGEHPQTDWIIKRACRTLLKAGHPKALQLFNYKHSGKTILSSFRLDKKQLKIGERLEFFCAMESLPKEALRVEYAIHYMKKNGVHSPKKFHLMDNINTESYREFSKSHSFEQRTTRAHHEGEHWLEIFVNGISMGRKSFYLNSA